MLEVATDKKRKGWCLAGSRKGEKELNNKTFFSLAIHSQNTYSACCTGRKRFLGYY